MEKLQTLGVIVFVAGILILTAYGLYMFLIAEDIPLIIRIGLAAMGIGVVIVILALVRERYQDIKKGKR